MKTFKVFNNQLFLLGSGSLFDNFSKISIMYITNLIIENMYALYQENK